MLGRADALWTLAKLQLTEWIWNSFMVSAPIGLMRDDSISRADGGRVLEAKSAWYLINR